MGRERLVAGLPAAGLAALTLALAFRSGGYYADVHGAAAAALLAVLAIRVVAVERPFAGVGRAAAVVVAALAALLAWTLASSAWSDAAARSITEANRVLLYLLVFGLFASAPRRPGGLARLLGGFTLAAAAVCVAALASRLYPDVVVTEPNIFPGRLAWPIGYWNALGLLAALAAIGLLHFAAAGRGAVARALAAAGLPIALTALLLAYSRGSLLVAIVGAGLYALLARPPGLAGAILAAAPAAAVALVSALGAGELAGSDPTSPAATREGHALALVVLGCSLAAGALRVLVGRWEGRLGVPRLPRIGGRRAAGLAAAAALVIVAVGVATGQLERGLQAFGGDPAASGGADARQRLLDASGSSRRAYWDAALAAFEQAPVHGTGAGTYQLAWWRVRPLPADVVNAHSLPLEILGELGVVGLLLLLVVLGGITRGLARRDAGDRAVRGAVLAALAAWLLHALIDWDWQLPVVSAWIFAVGGAALAAPAAAGARRRAVPLTVRAAVAFALLAAALGPGLLAISERRTRAALTAFAAGDCAGAAEEARLARRALAVRPEPDAVLGFCAARAGRFRPAVAALARAGRRDPESWEYAYGETVVRMAAGLPAGPPAARAARLNPLQPDLAALRASLAAEDPRTQKRRALGARLFLSGFDYPSLGT